MTIVSETVLAEMVQAIVREVDPEQIYLFGSHARGEARADSDVDLLVVEREPFGPRHSRFQQINRLYRALSSFRIPKDILLYSRDEFAKWRNSLNSRGGAESIAENFAGHLWVSRAAGYREGTQSVVKSTRRGLSSDSCPR